MEIRITRKKNWKIDRHYWSPEKLKGLKTGKLKNETEELKSWKCKNSKSKEPIIYTGEGAIYYYSAKLTLTLN